MATKETDFLAGVIEGFYGKPWTRAERLELFAWMGDWGLNTYLYAPKDDLKHRTLWREPYNQSEAEEVNEIIRACKQPGIRFIYALSPGLDIRYSNRVDLEQLSQRFDQMIGFGCRHFALLFDDLPGRMGSEDLAQWDSLAEAQCYIANAMFRWTRQRVPEARLLFCPTAYCGRMVARKHGGEKYLQILGRELLPEIEVLWTGAEIISREITLEHAEELRTVLRRKPLIWDNLHANDYDGRRFYCGPYSGRPPDLRSAVAGLLVNPNCEFPLNFVPLRTFGEFVRSTARWDDRAAYLSALREWLPRFATLGEPAVFEDLVLFGDCYYLPHEEGPEANTLYEEARNLLGRPPASWGVELERFQKRATRLREFCARLSELRDRPLFYALSRHAWELREEMDLLLGYLAFKSQAPQAGAVWRSDSHLIGTYRGGLVPRFQQLLAQQSDGTYRSWKQTRPLAEART